MGAVFLGTPAAAIPSLSALADVEDVDLVITQPDRRSGRGAVRTAPPVKTAAQQFGFPVAQPESAAELDAILGSSSSSIGVVVAYGRILSPHMLETLPLGFLNVHFSLLPRWRGAAPVERAIAERDERTGVTLMRINEGLDTGPVVGEISTPIAPNETGGSLTARLAHLGALLLDDVMPEYIGGTRRPVPQLGSGVTHAARLTKEGSKLAPDMDAAAAEARVRAFLPRPVAWIQTDEGPLRVHGSRLSEHPVDAGSIEPMGTHVVAGFSTGALELFTVQPPGKPLLAASSWMNGRRGEPVRFT